MAAAPVLAALTVAETITRARAADGSYISWREHIIDDPSRGVPDLSGSDGLAMADLDRDGFVKKGMEGLNSNQLPNN